MKRAPPAQGLKACAGCGTPFDCGAGRAACWCNDLPLLPAGALEPAADCYCPACLRARIARTRAERPDAGR